MPASRAIISQIEKMNLSHKTAYTSQHLKQKQPNQVKITTDVKSDSKKSENQVITLQESKLDLIETNAKVVAPNLQLNKKNQFKKKQKESEKQTEIQPSPPEKEIASDLMTEVVISSGNA